MDELHPHYVHCPKCNHAHKVDRIAELEAEVEALTKADIKMVPNEVAAVMADNQRLREAARKVLAEHRSGGAHRQQAAIDALAAALEGEKDG